ncbi:MAG TPA: hypothetical protein DCM59_07155 [Clostridium sp.]|nr:hypothetical protein [Clostridium sp.]
MLIASSSLLKYSIFCSAFSIAVSKLINSFNVVSDISFSKNIREVINAHFKKGYYLIGALKTNRVIYPKGIGIQIKQFTQYIEKNDVCLVTVNNYKYWVYRYEGNLNGIDNAVVLFCWPENSFKKEGALHTFLCTDIALDTQTILEYYSKRWPIEIFFRQTKNNLGLNTYQVRSTQYIDRLLFLISLTHIYCSIQEKANDSFSKGLIVCRNEVKNIIFNGFMNVLKAMCPLRLF